jgi:hypothetical protein
MEPLVFVHILAKDKKPVLPLYLECIENLDYPKNRMIVYIRTNNNQDSTDAILMDWYDKVRSQYHSIILDDSDVSERVQDYRGHEWNDLRLNVIRRLRDDGLNECRKTDAEFYFTVDCDNFVKPNTLRMLVEANKTVIAPLLRYAYDPEEKAENPWANPWYSNFANKVNDYGDVMDNSHYYGLLERNVPGLHEVELVHATYLVRRDIVDVISYQNGTMGWDYINFASNLRRAGIPQILDNREVYGCMTLAENEPASRAYMEMISQQGVL